MQMLELVETAVNIFVLVALVLVCVFMYRAGRPGLQHEHRVPPPAAPLPSSAGQPGQTAQRPAAPAYGRPDPAAKRKPIVITDERAAQMERDEEAKWR